MPSMSRIVQFGEEVEGYSIRVLNEREIRAAAGLLFLMMFVSIQLAAGRGYFVPLKYAITLFLTDISIRVFINPRYSPTLILGRLIVRKQTPEYVGAPQKRFAWIIGFVLAAVMFVHVALLNAQGPIAGIICLICLVFLFFETAFGICIGCKVYSLIYREKAQYCPGEVCDVSLRQPIQKTSKSQMLVALAFALYIVMLVLFFNRPFSAPTHVMFGPERPAQTQ
jgi:hypothetical protein